MPAQALIRNLTKVQVDAEITKAKAADLLEAIQTDSGLLIRCKADGESSVPTSPAALQTICDIDAKITREKVEAARVEAAKKAAAEATKPPIG